MFRFISIMTLLLVTSLAQLAEAAPVVIQAQMPILNFFGIRLKTAAPLPSEGKPTFRAPNLEIFSPDGTMIYYSDSTNDIVKTLTELRANIRKMKPISGYVTLSKLLSDLQSAGAQNLNGVGKSGGFTIILVELSGDQCEPCKQTKDALSRYIQASTNSNNTIVELNLSNAVK